MSQTSRSPIHVEGSTPRKVTTEIRSQKRTSGTSSGSHRSSTRHAGIVAHLETVVKLLVNDATQERSSLGAFPAVLDGALSRFLEDARRRGLRRGGTSSTRQNHFMDSRDRGPRTRAEREEASQLSVKARRQERDQEIINRGD